MSEILKPPARGRSILALAISLLPLNALRVFAYRRLFRYEIGRGARIGLLTVIACDRFRCGARTAIGRNNVFLGPFAFKGGDDVIIGRANRFVCGASAASTQKSHMGYARQVRIGDGALVNDEHYFDCYGAISIGDRTWVAGVGSQFWTHGASVADRDIEVGSGCYLGSGVRLAPGSAIGSGCVLGLGSVVVSPISEVDAVLAGFPAKKIRDIRPEDERQFVFTAG